MNTAKKLLAILLAATTALAFAACKNTPATTGDPTPGDDALYHIGLLQLMDHPSLNTIRESIEAEIIALGYGDLIAVEVQDGLGESATLTSIAQKFVGDEKDLIVTIGTSAAQSVASATGTIPQVFAAISDPVGAKLVETLEAPGGNSTGTSDALPIEDVFDLILTLTPDIKTLGLLYSTGEDNSYTAIEEVKAYCDRNGIATVESTATNVGEVQQAAANLVGRVDAIFTPTDNVVASAMPAVTKLTRDNKIPFYVGADSMVKDGGFATIGIDYEQLGKQTARMAVDILVSGADPATMPVQTLDNFATYINTTTAEAIGIEIPAELLSAAELFE